MNRNGLPSKRNEDADRAENARRTLITHLAGDPLDVGPDVEPGVTVDEAINTLCELAPDILLDLRQRLIGEYEQAEAVCWEMSEFLDEYLSEAAPARTPPADSHLASCRNCQDQLETLRAVVNEQREGWMAFSQSLGSPKQALVLTSRAGWQLRGAARSRWRALTEQDVASGRAIGAWRLAPTPARAQSFKLHGDNKPPCSLSLLLPEDAALILLHVVPDRLAAVHKEIWQLIVELDPGSRLNSLIVGIGNEQAITKGSVALDADRERTFQIEPPKQDTYWLHFAWPPYAAAGAEWPKYKVELPLRFDPNGEEL